MTKIDFVGAVSKTEVFDLSKDEWHPKYEQAGVWARAFIKQYIWVMITYSIYGAIFAFTYSQGGYPALIISIGLSIIYTINRVRTSQ